MRAWLLNGFGEGLVLGDLPEPEPGSGEVVVEVAACSVGTGERLIAAGGRQAYTGEAFAFPHVLGYQACGRVAVDGHGWSAGQRVVVDGIFTCGQCRYCRSGRQNLCASMRYMGIDSGLPGAFAERVAVPATNLFALPDSIDDLAATVVSEFATAVHVARKLGLDSAGRAVLIGFGRHGAAIGAVLRARAAALSIAAIDPALPNAEAAGALGITLHAGPEDCAGGATGVVDTVGSGETLARALDLLAPDGMVVMLGVQPRLDLALAEPYRLLTKREATITGSVAKTPRDFGEAIAIVGGGAVPAPLLAVEAIGWRDLPDGWAREPSARLALVWRG